ncbi:hypothetical protein OSTOST_22234, partial [Ostertagia ostertagi]
IVGTLLIVACCLMLHVFPRLANTLRLVPHLHWIVVEDGNETVPYVGKILERSTLPFTYFAAQTPADHP